MSHAPTPWSFYKNNGPREVTLKRDHWAIGKNGGNGVGLIFGDDDANAAIIVRAVNSHEALVEALNESNEALKAWLHSYAAEDCDEKQVQRYKQIVKDEGGTLAYLARRFAMIKAALALAKGQP